MFTQVRALLMEVKPYVLLFVYIDGDVSNTSLIYLQIVSGVLTLGLGECDCVQIPPMG